MIPVKAIAVLFVLMSFKPFVSCQRSPYAGSRPNGYKDRFVPKPNDSASINNNEIVNRFGGANANDLTQRPPMNGVQVVQGQPSTGQIGQTVPQSRPQAGTQQNIDQQINRLPFDAHGDADLVNLLLSRPIEQRPFWLLNYEAIEAHRNSSTQGNYNPIASRSSFLGK